MASTSTSSASSSTPVSANAASSAAGSTSAVASAPPAGGHQAGGALTFPMGGGLGFDWNFDDYDDSEDEAFEEMMAERFETYEWEFAIQVEWDSKRGIPPYPFTHRGRYISRDKPFKPYMRLEKPIGKRKLGKLKNVLEFPLDVMYEMLSHLEPQDLLQMSRLTKEFRGLLLSRSSRGVWKRSLLNVPDLPPCPDDLSEPEYVSLCFDKMCMACGATKGHVNAVWSLRVRLCDKCWCNNISIGVSLRSVSGMTPDQLKEYGWPCLPKAGDGLSEHGKYDAYFIPEAVSIFNRVERLLKEDDKDALAVFVDEAKGRVKKITDHAISLRKWQSSQESKKKDEKVEATRKRKDCMLAEMKTLGWDGKYYPQSDDMDRQTWKTWNRMLTQPTRFTRQGWNRMFPKLEEIYLRCKKEYPRAKQPMAMFGLHLPLFDLLFHELYDSDDDEY